MSDQTPFRGTVDLAELGGYDLAITYNGLIAVRHTSCGGLMILEAGLTDLPSVIQGAKNHTCPKTYYTDQELLDLGILHVAENGILTYRSDPPIDWLKSHVPAADIISDWI